MNWNAPNLLTIGRLGLSVVFFVMLANCAIVPEADSALLIACAVIYIIAGLTDILDGYLARKLNASSVFGRIADPFVDKVMVCGAFALLAGSNFVFGSPADMSGLEARMPQWLHGGMASAVQAWMVVVLIAREFVISGIRGFSESQGITFAATWAGKVKMLVQSVAICTVLFQLAIAPHAAWAVILKISLIWLTVIVTLASGLIYVRRARALLSRDRNE